MAGYRPSAELRVVKPCGESWQAMGGGSRVRHCGSCERDVVNVAAMTPRELEAVIAEGQRTGAMPCMRVVRDEDGLLMTVRAVERPRLLTRMAAAVSMVVAASVAAAQSAKPAAKVVVLEGRVTDSSGVAIPGATVELRHDQQVIAGKTDEHGVFAVSGAAGDYEVVATMAGFATSGPGRVHLQSGVRELNKAIQLQVGMVEMGEVVTVPLKTHRGRKVVAAAAAPAKAAVQPPERKPATSVSLGVVAVSADSFEMPVEAQNSPSMLRREPLSAPAAPAPTPAQR